MSKHKQPKKRKPARTSVSGGNWQKLEFAFVRQFYLAGQDAARAVLEKAPDCHETCTTNAMLSFYLGALMPVVATEADLQRLAVQVLPRIVESIAIVSGMTSRPFATCCPPSHNDTWN